MRGSYRGLAGKGLSQKLEFEQRPEGSEGAPMQASGGRVSRQKEQPTQRPWGRSANPPTRSIKYLCVVPVPSFCTTGN